jgi:RimJ/RimL family protein N-acetyltransferase
MGQSDRIETGRLLLRRWRESDRAPFAELNGDPQTLVHFPETFGRQESDALIDRAEANFESLGYGLWALEVKGSGEFIGFTGLAPMPDDVPGAGGVEIGWRLARRAWHRGYATEAAAAAARDAFGRVGLAGLWSMTAILNEPSQAVMRRIGMTEVARFDHPRVPHGHPLRPHVTYYLARPLPRPPADHDAADQEHHLSDVHGLTPASCPKPPGSDTADVPARATP